MKNFAPNIEIIVLDDGDSVCRKCAEIVAQEIAQGGKRVLAFPTGKTPIPLYKELVRKHRDEGLSFKNVISFNLDEFIGIDRDHPGSYFSYMKENLFNGVDVCFDNIFMPENEHYDAIIHDHGGIDISILGIGGNGHIAFNEPGSEFDSRTRAVDLDESTRISNKIFFDNLSHVPKRAYTMGVGTIMESRKCILMAYGESKAEIVARALQGEIGNDVPATVLQRHQGLTVLLDKKAARYLEK